MPKRSKKSKSNRMTLKQKYKVIKKVKEHHRKQRKQENKRKRAGIKPKAAKDPGIPAAWPFKEELVQEIQATRHRMLELARERRERLKRQRDEDQEMGGATAEDLQVQAAAKLRAYEQGSGGNGGTGDAKEASRRAFYKEFVKVVDAADVIIQVLDARDPLAFRCAEVERFIRGKDPNKRIVLLLNKIDLVPREVVTAWLKYFKEELPTVAFKCSTQQQATRLAQKRGKAAGRSKGGGGGGGSSGGGDVVEGGSGAVGAEQLLQLLKNYARNKNIKTAVTVGVIGLPNVGKSSLINSLKRTRVAAVGNAPGVTRAVQQVHLDKHVKLLDSPGIVFSTGTSTGNGHPANTPGAPGTPGVTADATAMAALRNAVRIEQLDDPVTPVGAIVQRMPAKQLMTTYKIPAFRGVDEFLQHVATARGKLKKGGTVDITAAARQVLQDWNDGTLRYYTLPPTRNSEVAGSAAVVTEWGKEFDLDDVQEGEMAMVEGLPSLDDDDEGGLGVMVESAGAPAVEGWEGMEGSDMEEGESEEEEEEGEDDMDEGEPVVAVAAGTPNASQRTKLYAADGQYDPHAARAARKRARKLSTEDRALQEYMAEENQGGRKTQGGGRKTQGNEEEDEEYDFAEFAENDNAYAKLAEEGSEEEEEEEEDDGKMSGSEIDDE